VNDDLTRIPLVDIVANIVEVHEKRFPRKCTLLKLCKNGSWIYLEIIEKKLV